MSPATVPEGLAMVTDVVAVVFTVVLMPWRAIGAGAFTVIWSTAVAVSLPTLFDTVSDTV